MSFQTLIASEIKPMPFEEKISHLVIYAEKWPSKRDWQDILNYVMKHEQQAMQFTLLDMLIERMAAININIFNSLFDYHLDFINDSKSLRIYLLLLGTALCYSSFSSTYTLQKSFENAIKRFGLLENEIMSAEGTPLNKLPQTLTDAITKGITTIPQFIPKCPSIFLTTWLMNLLRWVAVCNVRSLDDLYQLDDFCRVVVHTLLNPYRTSSDADKQHTAASIVKLIFQLCLMNYEATENYFMVLQYLPDHILHKGIASSKKEFSDFKAEDYVRLLEVLTQSSLSQKTLKLALYLSELLHEQKEYFILRCIYDDFIVPRIIAGPLKMSAVGRQELHEFVLMYVEGLHQHISISSQQLRELVGQLTQQEPAFIDYWLRVAFIIVHPQPQLVKTLSEAISFRSKNRMNDYLSEEDYSRIRSHGWAIPEKALDQKKLCLIKKGSINGIRQLGDPHITCVLQLLFMSKHFPELLKQYEVDYTDSNVQTGQRMSVIRSKLLYEFKVLFDQLKNPGANVTVEKIIAHGPEEHRAGKGAKDCVQYIEKLFEKIVAECNQLVSQRRGDMVTKFKNMFRAVVYSSIECQKCHTKSDHYQDIYVHRPEEGQFLTEWTCPQSFTCDKCKHSNKDQQLKQSITVYPEILLVCLDRFSDKKIKDLSQYPVPRRLKEHYLAGFICHQGKELAGSYTLYYRNEENMTKWYKFEAAEVYTFETPTENEEFEKQFDKEHTPYLLVYQKYQRSSR